MSTSSIDLVHSAFSAFVLFSFPRCAPIAAFFRPPWAPYVSLASLLRRVWGLLYIFKNFREVVRIFENSMTMGSQRGKYHTSFPCFCLWAANHIKKFFMDLAFSGSSIPGNPPLSPRGSVTPPNLARLTYALPSYRYTDSIGCFSLYLLIYSVHVNISLKNVLLYTNCIFLPLQDA